MDLLLTEGKSEPLEMSSDAPTLGEYSVAVNLPDGIPDGIENQLVDTVLGINVLGYTRSVVNPKCKWQTIYMATSKLLPKRCLHDCLIDLKKGDFKWPESMCWGESVESWSSIRERLFQVEGLRSDAQAILMSSPQYVEARNL